MLTNHKGLPLLPRSDSLSVLQPGKPRKRARVAEEIPRKHRFHPLVAMYIGRRGGGKTAAMSVTSKLQQRRNRARGSYRSVQNPDGYALAANYKLLFAEYITPFLVNDLMHYELMGGEASPFNLLVNIDEAAANFPSRRSMAGDNVDFSNVLTQIRKFQSEVNFTTQFPQVMDLQILWQVDLFIRCRTPDYGRTIYMDYYDWWGQWTGRDFRKPWPPQPGWQDWTKVYRNCHLIWDQYDTREVQVAIWSKYRERMLTQAGWEIVDGEAGEESERTKRELAKGRERRSAEHKPRTVTEALMQAGPSFQVLSQLPTIQALDPTLNTVGKLNAYLKQHGYAIRRPGGTWVAYAPTPGNKPEGD